MTERKDGGAFYMDMETQSFSEGPYRERGPEIVTVFKIESDRHSRSESTPPQLKKSRVYATPGLREAARRRRQTERRAARAAAGTIGSKATGEEA